MKTHSLPALTFRAATAEDFEWTHDLTRRNMEEYVIRHWGPWSRDIYTTNYDKGHNYILCADAIPVGYIRLLPQAPVLFLDDFQIAASHQRRGYGSWALAHLDTLLPHFGCTAIRLRCYHENPARSLYLRTGFREIERSVGTSILERCPSPTGR